MAELGKDQHRPREHGQSMISADFTAFAAMGAQLLIYHRHSNLAALFLQKGSVRKEKVRIGLFNITICDCNPPITQGIKRGSKRGGDQSLASAALAASYG
jgi:hypothetical protein